MIELKATATPTLEEALDMLRRLMTASAATEVVANTPGQHIPPAAMWTDLRLLCNEAGAMLKRAKPFEAVAAELRAGKLLRNEHGPNATTLLVARVGDSAPRNGMVEVVTKLLDRELARRLHLELHLEVIGGEPGVSYLGIPEAVKARQDAAGARKAPAPTRQPRKR